MSEETELAWAAGFFDGEGYTGTNWARTGWVLQISITQKDRQVLDRFKQAVGRIGVNINGPYKNYATHRLYASNGNAIDIFNKIKPYLSKIKLEQGERAVAEYEAYCLRQVA